MPNRLVISIHGMWTYGRWQERLSELTQKYLTDEGESRDLFVVNYDYGVFPLMDFIIPFRRQKKVQEFTEFLKNETNNTRYDRIDIFAHSFGTQIVSDTLKYWDHEDQKIRVHTAVFCGAVINPDRDLTGLVGQGRTIHRLVNDCGLTDKALLMTLLVFGVGMGGRLGLHGGEGANFRNRYFDFGHSGYFFQSKWGGENAFMERWWLPLMAEGSSIEPYDERPSEPPVGDRFWRILGDHGTAVTALVYCVLLLGLSGIFGSLWIRSERAEAEAQMQRIEALEERDNAFRAQSRFLADRARSLARNDEPIKGLLLALNGAEDKSLDPRGAPVNSRPSVDEVTSALYLAYSYAFPRTALAGHTHTVNSASVSYDTRKVVTGSDDGTVRVWDGNTGKPISVLLGHCSPAEFYGSEGCGVRLVSLSPDDKRILSASWDGTARLWDIGSGREIAVLKGHCTREKFRYTAGCSVSNASFSPDGKRILTSSTSDHVARLWNGETGILIATLDGHTKQIWDSRFSPDGKYIATASSDNSARIWNAENGTAVTVLKGHKKTVFGTAFNHDGGRLVSRSADKTARIWDIKSGDELAVLTGHEKTVSGAAFSFDGQRVITRSSVDRTVRIWDARTGKNVAVLKGHAGAVNRFAVTPNDKTIVSVSSDQTGRLWNARTGAEIAILDGHSDNIKSIDISSDSKRILTASSDGTARLWNAETGAEIATLRGHTESVGSAFFSAHDSLIVTLSSDGTVRLWDGQTAQSIAQLSGHTGPLTSARFSSDGSLVVTSSRDGTARIWNTQSGVELAVLLGHQDAINDAAFILGDHRVVTISSDMTARIWDSRTGQERAVLKGHKGAINGLAFSPDGGRRVVTASSDKTARIWDTNTGKEVAVLSGHTGTVNRAVFSPDANLVVTTSFDKTARLWDARTGEPRAVLKGHTGRVSRAAFSPTSSRVVTASSDNTARIWDARSGKEVAVLEGHARRVSGVAYSPDGKLIVTTSGDWTVKVWDAETTEQLKNLTGHCPLGVSYGFLGCGVQGPVFDPSSTKLATAASDFTVRIWNVRNGAEIAVFEQHCSENAIGFDSGWGCDIPMVRFSPDGAHIVTASDDQTARVWRVFSSTQELVNHAKRRVPFCLTGDQREEYYLSKTPPRWCITGPGFEGEADASKWQPKKPYDSADWREWLSARDRGQVLPLPR